MSRHRRLRRSLTLGILAAAIATSTAGQEVSSPRTLEELFVKLGQLQDANLGVARQMSETQLRAAAIVQAALNEGAISDRAHREIAGAFIANALTLASVLLAPVATQQVAAGDVLMSLLRRNLILLKNAEPLFEQDAEFAAVMKQYAVLQMQTEDLAVALRNGWSRYGETLTTAEIAGMLSPGSFDPAGRSWRLQTPALVDGPPAASELNFESGADAAEVYGTIGLEAPAPIVAPPGGSGQEPGPAGESQAEPRPGAEATAPERLSAGDPLALAEDEEPRQSSPWVVTTDDAGRATATSGNANASSAERIKSLQISCNTNGTLRYYFAAADEFPEYWIYANETEYATVRAESNAVSGGEALKMSDTLRLAFEWATRDPAKNAPIVVSPGDEVDLRAEFPIEGYIEARGKVLDACEPWEEAVEPGSEAPSNGESPSASAPPPGPPVAPIPHPRPRDRMPAEFAGAG